MSELEDFEAVGAALQNIADLLDESPISFEKIDLRKKFKKFNRRYFDNALPNTINLKFEKLKGASGITSVLPKEGTLKGDKRDWDHVQHDRIAFIYFKIVMNTAVRYDEKDFDGYFLHEMIHAYFFANGWLGVGHGPRFKEKAREIGRKAGLTIPLSHKLKGDEALDVDDKKLGLVLTRLPGRRIPSFNVFEVDYLDEWVSHYEKHQEFLVKVGDVPDPTSIYVIKTKIHYIADVKKKPDNRLTKLTKVHLPHLDFSRARLVKEWGRGIDVSKLGSSV